MPLVVTALLAWPTEVTRLVAVASRNRQASRTLTPASEPPAVPAVHRG